MVRDRAVAEAALVRYYNSASRKKAGKAEFGPLAEALAMVKAGFDVQSNPFLQVGVFEELVGTSRLSRAGTV